MAISYPTTLDVFTNPTATSKRDTPSLAGQQSDQNDAIEALEAKVGVTGSAVTSTLDYKVTSTSSSNPGHKHTLATGATNVTATATELNFSSGVTSAIQTQLNAKQATLTLPLTVSNGGTGDASLTAYAPLFGGTTSTGVVQSGTVGTSGQVLTSNGAGALPTFQTRSSFWTTVPGTPTRVSDTQFTITDTANANLYDKLFKKGVVLKWDESGTFQTGMIISSSYSANAVTINFVGDSLTAGFTTMQYGVQEAYDETFVIPGNQAADTDVSKQWYAREDLYLLSADARVKTAGTTNSTVYDINVGGSTKFTTKPTITTGTTSDLDNVADTPSTAIAKNSQFSIDIDSASTTQAIEGYITIYFYPVSWRYRT